MNRLNPDAPLGMTAGAKTAGVSIQTFWRWALYGIRGGHKVQTWLRGGRRYTSTRAIESFFARLNANENALPAEPIVSPPSPSAADAICEAGGF